MATVLLVLSAFLFPLFIHHRSGSLADTPKRINEIKVQPGVKTKLQLPDKSQVWVNSDSKLSYPDNFNGATREVFLDGEAYFDVIKDSDHPFIVHTAGLDIKVLGTAFNVKAYRSESQIEATLIHGMIEVTRTNQPNAPRMILKPHEKMVFDKYAVEEIPVTDARITDNKAVQPAITILPLLKNRADSALSETSWVYNRLSFEDEKFGDLALKMERWFNVVINMSNEKLRAFRLTGSFEKETIEEALRELQYLVSFQYRISGNEISIEKK